MNPYTHFYLYARGWYQKSENIMDDLKVLTGDFCSIKPEYVSERDVFQVLTKVTWQELNRSGNGKLLFQHLMSKIITSDWTRACMNILMLGETQTLEISCPDSRILPYAENITEDIIHGGGYNWAE